MKIANTCFSTTEQDEIINTFLNHIDMENLSNNKFNKSSNNLLFELS